MESRTAMWPWVIVAALAVVLVVLLMEPCSMFRLKVVATKSGFGPLDTYAAPSVDPTSAGACMCQSNGRYIMEGAGGRPVEMNGPAYHDTATIETEVTF